jgi:hypothetical protein
VTRVKSLSFVKLVTLILEKIVFVQKTGLIVFVYPRSQGKYTNCSQCTLVDLGPQSPDTLLIKSSATLTRLPLLSPSFLTEKVPRNVDLIQIKALAFGSQCNKTFYSCNLSSMLYFVEYNAHTSIVRTSISQWFLEKNLFIYFKNNFTRINYCRFIHDKSHIKPLLSYLPRIVRRKYFSNIFNVKKCTLYSIKYGSCNCH